MDLSVVLRSPCLPEGRPDATGRRDLEASVIVVFAVVVTEAAASQETIEPSENSGELFSLCFFFPLFLKSLCLTSAGYGSA